MNKLKTNIILSLLVFFIGGVNKLKGESIRDVILGDSITIVINHTSDPKRAFGYIDYFGDSRVAPFPTNDTLKIINKNGIVAHLNFMSKRNSSYFTLYAGDTVELNDFDKKEIFFSKSKALQAKIELMDKLLFNIQSYQSVKNGNFHKDLLMIDSAYNFWDGIINSYEGKVNRKTIIEAKEISGFNHLDSVVSLHTYYKIKNDQLFNLKSGEISAWNYMAFGHLSFRFTNYIKKVYNINSAFDIISFIDKNIPAPVKENIMFNFIRLHNLSNKYKSDTSERLMIVFIKNAKNKDLSNYMSDIAGYYSISQEAEKLNEIMLSGVSNTSISLQKVLQKYKNKVIYLDFWASWCFPCLIEMPGSQKLYSKLLSTNKNIVFLYLSQDTNVSSWKNKSIDINLSPERNFLLQKNKSLDDFIKKYNLTSIPRYMIVNKNGVIVNSEAPRPSNAALEKELLSLSDQ